MFPLTKLNTSPYSTRLTDRLYPFHTADAWPFLPRVITYLLLNPYSRRNADSNVVTIQNSTVQKLNHTPDYLGSTL